jgi:hypothetical protein
MLKTPANPEGTPIEAFDACGKFLAPGPQLVRDLGLGLPRTMIPTPVKRARCAEGHPMMGDAGDAECGKPSQWLRR